MHVTYFDCAPPIFLDSWCSITALLRSHSHLMEILLQLSLPFPRSVQLTAKLQGYDERKHAALEFSLAGPLHLIGLSPVTSIFLKRMQLYCPFWLATFHCVHMHTSLHRSSAAGYLGWSCSSCWEWRSSGQGWAGASVMCGPGASDKYGEWEEWRCGWAQGKVCLSLAVAIAHFCFQPTFNKLVS